MKSNATKKGPRFQYDWKRLMRPGTRTLRRGEGFTCNPASFVSVLHQRAKAEGLIVRSSVDGDEVTFRFTKPEAGK